MDKIIGAPNLTPPVLNLNLRSTTTGMTISVSAITAGTIVILRYCFLLWVPGFSLKYEKALIMKAMHAMMNAQK